MIECGGRFALPTNATRRHCTARRVASHRGTAAWLALVQRRNANVQFAMISQADLKPFHACLLTFKPYSESLVIGPYLSDQVSIFI